MYRIAVTSSTILSTLYSVEQFISLQLVSSNYVYIHFAQLLYFYTKSNQMKWVYTSFMTSAL